MAEAGPSQVYSSSSSEGYSDERFLSVLRELWGLKITPQELQQLKPELVQKLYYAFLKDIGVNLEKLNEIPPQLRSSIQCPEDYTGVLRLTVLSSNMRKYLKIIFDDDTFRLIDVFNPKPKRSRKFFAMIYNFMVFTEGYFDELEEKEDEIYALVERRDKMKVRLQKIKRLVSERMADNTRCEVSKEEEIRRLEEKTKELQKCQEEKLVLKGQLDALNQSLAGLSTVTKDAELRIMEGKDEVQMLEGLVIQPCEEEEIRKRNMKLTSLKEETQRRKDHVTQLQQKITSKTSLKEKVDRFMCVLQETELEKSKDKDLQTSIEQKRSQIFQLYEEIKSREEQNLQLTQRLTSTVTNFQNKQQTWELKQKSLRNEIEEQKQVLEGVHRDQTEVDIVCKDMMDNFADLEEKIIQCTERTSRVNAIVKDNYQDVLHMVEEKNMELANILKKAAETLEEFKKLGD